MTIKQILELEPRLLKVELFVKGENKRAKKEKVYWHNVWSEVKKMQKTLIGDYAEQEELSDISIWDTWYEYLLDITPDMI